MSIKLNIVSEIDESWSLKRILAERTPFSWESLFRDSEEELNDIFDILDEQEKLYGPYFPLKADIFNAFYQTPLNKVRVVIVGQDPYHQYININGEIIPKAVGLSFSVRKEDSIPSSLLNIYKELSNTVRGFNIPDHGDLTEWTKRGVLLLNMSLTVRARNPGSHGDLWLSFINKVFKSISVVNPYCIYLLWGKEAQKVKPMLGERSVILEAAHPSGLSARKGFFGCDHFNEVNKILISKGEVGIDWNITPLRELLRPTSSNANINNNLSSVDFSILPSLVNKK